MNWEKACQSCSQFSWYRNRVEASEKPVSGGLVIFEEFSGDWARRKPKWLLESGWNFFYGDHHEVEGLRVGLLRLRGGTLESFPAAFAAASADTKLTLQRVDLDPPTVMPELRTQPRAAASELRRF